MSGLNKKFEKATFGWLFLFSAGRKKSTLFKGAFDRTKSD